MRLPERGLGLDLFLRMQRDAHEALQPTKDEAKNDVEPIRPVFRRAEPTAPGKSQTSTAGPAPPPPLTVDGQVYE